jgi:hypothetical protein
MCALTGTLIADVDGVYSPTDFNSSSCGPQAPAAAVWLHDVGDMTDRLERAA